MRVLKLLLPFLILIQSTTIFAQKTIQPNQKMQWFADAKLGIFIHWGIYSVNGISESLSFFILQLEYQRPIPKPVVLSE